MPEGKPRRRPSKRWCAGYRKATTPFVIVSVDSLTYIQAVWAESGFLVEHQEGDLSRHYLSERDDLSVFDLLKAYARKDPDWARGVAFEHMVLPEPTPRQGFLARIFSRLFGRSH